jgi:cyanate permease
MAKKITQFISPIILLVEIMIFSWIAELLRQPSDVAVLAGVILVGAALVGNYFLIKFIQKQFKQTTK